MVRRASVSALVDPRMVTVLPDRAAKRASGDGVRVLRTTEPLIEGIVEDKRPLIVSTTSEAPVLEAEKSLIDPVEGAGKTYDEVSRATWVDSTT